MDQKLQQTVGDVYGLTLKIATGAEKLLLSPEQIEAFLDATPNGRELMDNFLASEFAPEDFSGYIISVLNRTEHPYTPPPA